MLASTGAPIEGVLTALHVLDVDGSLPQPTSTATTSVHSGVTVFNLTLRVTCCRKRILLETLAFGPMSTHRHGPGAARCNEQRSIAGREPRKLIVQVAWLPQGNILAT